MNKQINFLVGLPRAGNTIFSSILNQNPKVAVTANSITNEIAKELIKLTKGEVFANFPYQEPFENVCKSVIPSYYKDWKEDHIITRGIWGTSINLQLLKSIIKQPKFIILHRPVSECVDSFIKIEKPINVEDRSKALLKEDGIIGKSLISINNIISQEDHIIINYHDFVKNPQNEINRICEYLKINSFKIDLNNIKQFSTNGIYYDDEVLPFNLHKIKTNWIK